MTVRSLVILDVDGPFFPWQAKPTRRPPGYETFRLRPEGYHQKKPLRMWLNPNHGDMLGALADSINGELVWCTTWLDQANTLIAPLVGLNPLPVIYFDVTDPEWKFGAVQAYSLNRPLVWFDDDFATFPGHRDRFIRARETIGARTLLRSVSPRVGLTFDDIAAANDWWRGLERGED